jgi:hypothetical protein
MVLASGVRNGSFATELDATHSDEVRYAAEAEANQKVNCCPVFAMRALWSAILSRMDRRPVSPGSVPAFIGTYEAAAVAFHICCEGRNELTADCHRV